MTHTAAFLLKERRVEDFYATIAGFKVETELHAENSLQITAKGIFTMPRHAWQMKGAAIYGDELPFELSFDGGERIRARFAIQRLDYVGRFSGETTHRLHMKSVGEVTRL